MTDTSSTREGFFRNWHASDKFMAVVWSLVAVVAVAIVGAVMTTSLAHDYNVRRMVESGADPIAARCALGGSHSNTLCVAYVVKGD